MTTQQIGYFLKLAEELNYTNVARMFFITQPTLSKQIVNLENELKVTLFQRDHNSVKLTPVGAKFYERMKPIFLDLMDAIRDVQGIEDHSNQLVVGIQEEQLVSNSFMLAINKIRYQYPDLELSIHRASFEELKKGLDEGKYDIINIFAYPNLPIEERFLFESLEVESAYLAYSPKLFSLKEEITSEQLTGIFSQYPLILPVVMEAVDDEQARKLLGVQIKDIDPSRIKIQLTQSGRAISLPIQVASQLGVSLCNRSNLFAIDPEIRLSKIQGTEGSYNKGLMYRRQPSNPYVKVIVRMTKEENVKYL